jgi:hypothetical protein
MNTRVQLSGLIVRLQWSLENPAKCIDTVDRAINVNLLFRGSIEEGNTS